MLYRRRATPLHVVRAAVGCAWCAALGLAALLVSDPVGLAAVLAAVLVAGSLAGCRRELTTALRFALPVALLVVVVNALVTRDGLTTIWRFGDLPLLGQTDVTLEATVEGATLGLRALALILVGALYTVAVDPDEVLALVRRISFRSALSATLAVRLVPVLARDGRRLAEAARCRPGPPPGRLALLRATSSGVLDRALDVAAALEVRGFAGARRPRRALRPWRRQEIAFACSAAGLLGLAVAGRVTGLGVLHAYPRLRLPPLGGALGLGAALLAVALAPFLVRRGIR